MSDTRQYELVYVVSPVVTDDGVTELHDRITGMVEQIGGRIDKTDNWGRRRLAYEIDRHREGTYVIVQITGPGTLVTELDRRLRLIEQLLRHLIVRVDEDLRKAQGARDRRQSRQQRRRAARAASAGAGAAGAPAAEASAVAAAPAAAVPAAAVPAAAAPAAAVPASAAPASAAPASAAPAVAAPAAAAETSEATDDSGSPAAAGNAPGAGVNGEVAAASGVKS